MKTNWHNKEFCKGSEIATLMKNLQKKSAVAMKRKSNKWQRFWRSKYIWKSYK